MNETLTTYVQQEESINTPIIDATNKRQVNKKNIVELLKKHEVNITAIEKPDIQLEDIIPTLRKAKVNLPESFFRDVASDLGMDFLEIQEAKKIMSSGKKSRLAAIVPYQIISKYQIIPLQEYKSTARLAISNPFDHQCMIMLQYLFGAWKSNIQVVSSKTVEWATDYLFSEIHKQKAMTELYKRAPDQSANKVLFPKQKYAITISLIALVISSIINSDITFTVLFSAITIIYFTINPIKIYTSIRGFQGPRALTRITKGEMQWVLDDDLPVYTILVPVFHEAKVLPQIMKNLYRLNYPKDKLDIKLLIEQKDKETLSEARKLGLFGSPTKPVEGIPKNEYCEFIKIFAPVIIPTGKVTTKPRACNYGLMRALGEYCVIYDAEDDPDPDQLKKAAIVFLRNDENVVCLQSKLNFYNADENILTKWFSIEYGYWYEFYLSGLDWINAPIPLGGTSNHFRTNKLNELGRWDPYNVTEDADIGIRIARRKFKTEMIETTTYEEATITVKSWIRQRSRWYKGHLQTYLVHMRHPAKLLEDLGLIKFIKFQLTFGGGIFVPIINPILWLLFIVTILVPQAFNILVPSYIQLISLFNLIFGNITYLLMYVVSCAKLKNYRLIPYAMLMPIYWGLISVASWRGLIQLIRKPFFWDKTNHGVSKFTR